MEKFKGIPNVMVKMYFAFLIGMIVSGVLFVLHISTGFVLFSPVYTFLIFISFIGLFKVIYCAVREYRHMAKKKNKSY